MRIFITIVVILSIIIVAPLVVGVFIWAFKRFTRNPLSLEDAVLSAYEVAYPGDKI